MFCSAVKRCLHRETVLPLSRRVGLFVKRRRLSDPTPEVCSESCLSSLLMLTQKT